MPLRNVKMERDRRDQLDRQSEKSRRVKEGRNSVM